MACDRTPKDRGTKSAGILNIEFVPRVYALRFAVSSLNCDGSVAVTNWSCGGPVRFAARFRNRGFAVGLDEEGATSSSGSGGGGLMVRADE
jgi:hypothetical protein